MLHRETNRSWLTGDEYQALTTLVEFAEKTLHHANETRGAVTIIRNVMRRMTVVHYLAPKSVEEELISKLREKERDLKERFPDLYSRVYGNTSPRGIVADDSNPEKN